MPTRLRLLHDPAVIPFAMSLALGIIMAGWNGVAGLSWTGPTFATILLALSPLLVLAGYTRLRGMDQLAETIIFGCMYIVVPLIAVRLSYLVTTLNFPLIDGRLSSFDHALGFDWSRWSGFINGHPRFHALTFAAYMSPIAQALLSAAIFSHLHAGRRNAEMLFTLVLALFVVIAIYTVLPELGPASLAGERNQVEASILALRAGSTGPFPYIGIVCFPSFHTVMAIVFTFSHRGLRSFWPVALLNALMLLGTPTYGDHYLADMFGGTAVAIVAMLICRSVYGRRIAVRAGYAAPAWNAATAG